MPAILDAFPPSWRPIAAHWLHLAIGDSVLGEFLASMRHCAVEAAVTGSSPCGAGRL